MKKNHMNIAGIVSVVIFVILLVYYLRRKEGYSLTDLNVGNWKMNATSDKLSVDGPEDKEVSFGSKISAKSLKAKSLDVTKDNGQGIVVDDNGDLHVYGKIFIHKDKNIQKPWVLYNEPTKESEFVITRMDDSNLSYNDMFNTAGTKQTTRYWFAGNCSRELCYGTCVSGKKPGSCV